MKKTLLVTAILAGFVPIANADVNLYKDEAHQVDLYGRGYAGYIYQNGNDERNESRSDSYFRAGFKIDSNLTGDLNALAHVELQFESNGNSDASSSTKTRLIYMGLKDDWGQVTFGRNYAADEIIADWTDAGTTNYSGNPALGNLNRQNNILKFETEILNDALQLVAHLQPETNGKTDNGSDSQSSLSFGGVYAFDLDFGLEVGATYTGVSSEYYSDNIGSDRSTILLATRYSANGLTASLVLDSSSVDTPNGASNKDSDDWTAYEIAVAYTLEKITGTVGYKSRDTDGISDKTVDEAAFGLAYQYNDSFRLVTEYVIKYVDNDEDQWHLAARYDF